MCNDIFVVSLSLGSGMSFVWITTDFSHFMMLLCNQSQEFDNLYNHIRWLMIQGICPHGCFADTSSHVDIMSKQLVCKTLPNAKQQRLDEAELGALANSLLISRLYASHLPFNVWTAGQPTLSESFQWSRYISFHKGCAGFPSDIHILALYANNFDRDGFQLCSIYEIIDTQTYNIDYITNMYNSI